MKEIKVKNKKVFPTIAVILISVIIVAFVILIDSELTKKAQENDTKNQDLLTKNESDSTQDDYDYTKTDSKPPETNIEYSKKELSELTYSGWIPVWDFADAINNIKASNYPFESVSPVWFSVNEDGTLLDRRTSSSSMISQIKSDIKIIPTIGLFNADTIHSVLSNENYFNTHVNTIINLVEENNYDGIDLDYEMTYLDDKSQYMKLLRTLSEKLHAKRKILSVTVLPQWETQSYNSFPETRQVQDPVEISKYADEIRIMCYAYTTALSEKPGPIGPILWIESVLKYFTNLVDSEKLVLGIHLYGYKWGSDESVQTTTYSDYATMKSYVNFSEEFNFTYNEGYSEYKIGEVTYQNYYQTPEGVIMRADLAAKYNLKGLIFWRMGKEANILELLNNEVKK